MTEETGWLIEMGAVYSPQYLTIPDGGNKATWTSVASDALRFARKVDAERYVAFHVVGVTAVPSDQLRVCEHAWS